MVENRPARAHEGREQALHDRHREKAYRQDPHGEAGAPRTAGTGQRGRLRDGGDPIKASLPDRHGAVDPEDLVEYGKEVLPSDGLSAEDGDDALYVGANGVVEAQVPGQYVDHLDELDGVEVQGHHAGAVRVLHGRGPLRRGTGRSRFQRPRRASGETGPQHDPRGNRQQPGKHGSAVTQNPGRSSSRLADDENSCAT